MSEITLANFGITTPTIVRNAAPAVLYEAAIKSGDATIAANGALMALSGEKTGRSPKDKRVVKSAASEADVWWGDVNIPLTNESFLENKKIATEYLNSCDTLYVFDGFAGYDPEHQIKVRVVCERPYHALFMNNMLIRPTAEELANYGEPDYVIFNAGKRAAEPAVPGVESDTSVSIHFEEKQFVILGTEYAGEMKKGVFTIMNYLMPKQGHLSMHCSANESASGDVSLFFGLSGTGKTTLSADPARRLIGDDEHVWTESGVFNIEGGCYAKAIDLSQEAEPDIFNAIRFGSVLENVVMNDRREVDYTDVSVTQNTRCAYPINYIDNAKIPCVGGTPKNIVFLTCDAFSVLPPVSRLNRAQAMYHFISGYTAKVAGTEMGITEPTATFSSCFGAPFLVWHPTKYAELLAEKMDAHDVNVWLVNTGWIGGPYGVGNRISIKHTRAIIDAIHDGSLANTETAQDEVFGLAVPVNCANVPTEILQPVNAWADKAAYQSTAAKLATLFHDNFETFKDAASEELLSGAPVLGR